jgi:DNA-binding NarL/FixJ family response regulator
MIIPIAIVDDKLQNRIAVKNKLIEFNEVQLCMQAVDGADFLEQLKAAKIMPAVVLMDLEMPVMNGIEAIQVATASYPNIKFIVLTVYEDNDKIFEAIKAGASGYLLKEENGVNIVDAIMNVYHYNGIPMSPAIARKAMELLKQVPVSSIIDNAVNVDESELKIDDNLGLSNRELDILKELVSGKNYKAIGETLYISPMTVRKHVSNIYEKLHVNTRAQLINIAHKKKWV